MMTSLSLAFLAATFWWPKQKRPGRAELLAGALAGLRPLSVYISMTQFASP
jgi:hypothetical protein